MLLPRPLPITHYYRCLDDTAKPANYVGDWPVRFAIYPGRLLPAFDTGAAHLHLDGFWAQEPWGAFAPGRFAYYTTIYLN